MAAPPKLEVHVEPSAIRKGESALLSWEARDAHQVSINQNIGSVATSGKIKFFPEETTTYTVSAEGAGGRVERSVRVAVLDEEVSGVSSENLRDKPLDERFNFFVKPVFFEFDNADLSDEAKLTLDGNVRWLLQAENLTIKFIVEGHCDERGTEEYNLALGDKRAQVVKQYLTEKGVDPSRIVTLSFGEERPFDAHETEEAWALNRRAHFVLIQE